MTGWTAARRAGGLDFGIELDYTYFRPSIKEQTVRISGSDILGPFGPNDAIDTNKIAITSHTAAINFLMRWPLGVTPELPHGRWYPYIGIGEGVEIARGEAAIVQTKDTSIAGVRQLLAGIKIFLTRRLAIFSEYKNAFAKHTFTFGTQQDQLTMNVNHFAGGLSMHF